MIEKINSFFLSEGYMLFCFICLGICFVFEIVSGIVAYFKAKKLDKRALALLHKYGVNIEEPIPCEVYFHVMTLIELCEEYNLDSLYEGQAKYDELFTCLWESRKATNEEMRKLFKVDEDLKEAFNFGVVTISDIEEELRSRFLGDNIKSVYGEMGAGREIKVSDEPREDNPDEI